MIGMGDRLLFLAGVPPEKMEECITWAFGKVDQGEPMEELANRWNQKHGKIFIVDMKRDNPKAFIWSIGKAYVEEFYPKRLVTPIKISGRFN